MDVKNTTTLVVKAFPTPVQWENLPWLVERGRWGSGGVYSDLVQKMHNEEKAGRLTVIQLLCARRHALIEKSIYASRISKQKAITLVRRYFEQKCSLQDIVHQFDIPPILALKVILGSERGGNMSEIMIRRIIQTPALLQNPREQHELKWALMNDTVNNAASSIREEATNFEKDIGSWLFKIGVVFRTEDDLKADARLKEQPLSSTPDFVFVQPVPINGKLIYWMDVKNFYASGNRWMTNKMQMQAHKYDKKFGSGAFVFAYGFSDVSVNKLSNVLLLDYRTLSLG